MTHAELCRRAEAALRAVPASLTPPVMVGFDGFVDSIADVVATRADDDHYTAFSAIDAFGARVREAAGKSANFEVYVKQVKIGGNGPIMANALCSYRFRVTAVGILGEGAIHSAFAPLAARAERVISLGAPAATDALEFADGKVMMVKSAPLKVVGYPALVKACGGVDGVRELFRAPAGIATVNWTMTIGMTAMWERLCAEILPGLRADRPLWFIDLADPAKRTQDDIRAGLAGMQALNRHVDVVLGLNEAECRQILAVLGLSWTAAASEWESARLACAAIRERLGISRVMCHLVKSSACAWQGGSVSAEGFFEPKPTITTGAGDHFNAGFFAASLAGLTPEACLQIGGATSGYYVRSGVSPTREQVCEFLHKYA